MALITDTIGETPLVRLQRIPRKGRVFVKLEARNPGGSVKDRAAFQMLKDMLSNKQINKDTMLVEPTSGNTGIGLCLVAASLGLKITVFMPSTMSVERQKLMKAYGATLVLTEGPKGINGSIQQANEFQKLTPNSIIVGQFQNQSNPLTHELTTGPELIRQVKQYHIEPKYFVSGIGTGGTITGCSKILKKDIKDIKIVGVEAEESRVFRGGEHKPHKIQGISPGFVPQVMDKGVVDQFVGAEQQQAFEMCRRLPKEEGILVGISSAAAISVAVKIAEENDCDVIVIAADSGERYLSVDGLF